MTNCIPYLVKCNASGMETMIKYKVAADNVTDQYRSANLSAFRSLYIDSWQSLTQAGIFAYPVAYL